MIYLLVIFANSTVELPEGNVGEARLDFIPQFTKNMTTFRPKYPTYDLFILVLLTWFQEYLHFITMARLVVGDYPQLSKSIHVT